MGGGEGQKRQGPDIPPIMGIPDRVYGLGLGRVIAEGRPEQVRHDPAVVASYLGTDERSIDISTMGPARTLDRS